MSSSMMVSLFILSFLIFMVMVLIYIKRAVGTELKKVRVPLLIKFAIAYASDVYNINKKPPGHRVKKVMDVMEYFEKEWNLSFNYNRWKMESRIRKQL
ncbi:MAG: hypothetical protein ACQEP7_04520 [bacterium]